MNSDENLPCLEAIRQELLDILNQNEVVSKLDHVFKKYKLLETKNIKIDFKFYDKPQFQNEDFSVANIAATTSLSANLQQVSYGFCPSPPCPPPGRVT